MGPVKSALSETANSFAFRVTGLVRILDFAMTKCWPFSSQMAKGRAMAKRLTPSRAIRKHCLWCANGSAHEVRFCLAETCPSWPLRFGKRVKGISPLKVIRKRCVDCSAFNMAEVLRCQFEDCSLFEYRFGHNPRKKGQGPKRPAFLPKTISTAAVSALQGG